MFQKKKGIVKQNGGTYVAVNVWGVESGRGVAGRDTVPDLGEVVSMAAAMTGGVIC